MKILLGNRILEIYLPKNDNQVRISIADYNDTSQKLEAELYFDECLKLIGELDMLIKILEKESEE